MRASLQHARRIVIKVGTRVVTHADGRLAVGRVAALVEQLRSLRDRGCEVLLVSSGAVGLGAERLGLPQAPVALVDRQACAAAGQGSLIAFYDGLLRRAGLTAAQVLLTGADFGDRRRYVHLAATLQRLMALGAIPIINENDTISTTELALNGQVFGDNDQLSALVAGGLGADLLVLLTNVNGLYDAPPEAQGASRVSTYDRQQQVTVGTISQGGRGGMGAKILAAQVATRSGVPVVVASGFDDQVLSRILAGDDVGTLFPAQSTGASPLRRWLAFATAPSGRLRVDAGAYTAITERGASLLDPGVVAVEGEFEAQAVVAIVNQAGDEFARGIVARASSSVRAWRAGSGRGKALVHRDNIVILEPQ